MQTLSSLTNGLSLQDCFSPQSNLSLPTHCHFPPLPELQMVLVFPPCPHLLFYGNAVDFQPSFPWTNPLPPNRFAFPKPNPSSYFLLFKALGRDGLSFPNCDHFLLRTPG